MSSSGGLWEAYCSLSATVGGGGGGVLGGVLYRGEPKALDLGERPLTAKTVGH